MEGDRLKFDHSIPMSKATTRPHLRRLGYVRCIALCLLSAYVLAGCGGGRGSAEPPSTAETTAAGDTTQPAPPPPSTVPMSWRAAGAFVWHETDVSPEALGAQMRHAGFGWVAVFLHDGISEDPVEDHWIDRFRQASGLAVGGWGWSDGRGELSRRTGGRNRMGVTDARPRPPRRRRA